MAAARMSLGVVPEEMSEWKPESAPHMITMQTNGQIAPGTTGPPPWMKGVVAGMFSFKPAQLLQFEQSEKSDVDVKELFK